METGDVIYPDDNHFHDEYRSLWQYLTSTRRILLLKNIPISHLKITAGYISSLIENGDENLKEYVPVKVFESIKKNKLFGYGRNMETGQV